MKKTFCSFLLAVTAMVAVPAYAQPAPKPDYSGSWKLNIDKSDFGQMPPPQSESLVVTQTATDFKMARTSVRDEGAQTYAITVKLDGSETPVPAGTFPDESPFKILSSKAEWDGVSLVVTQKSSFQDNPGTLKSTYALSADGKLLTVTTDISMSSMGDFTIKVLYDKQ